MMGRVLSQIDARLTRIERYVRVLMRAANEDVERDEMAQQDIDRLKESLRKNRDAVAAAAAAIKDLAQKVRDASDDPEELQALATEFDQNALDLANAIVEGTTSQPNTPAA